MPPHITTEEAKKQALPGSDVYRYSHRLYQDDLHRDDGVVRLNIEANKAFSDTVILTQRHALAAERAAARQWRSQGGFEAGLPFPGGEASHAMLEYVNYEHLKIGLAFELHLKARLLARNYVLHEIETTAGYKDLAAEQKKRPILKQELFSIQPYHFDGRRNYLPGLQEASLKFSWLTDKPAYRAVLRLTAQQLDIIQDYRLLRNQVHFPGDVFNSPHIQAIAQPISEFLIAFINSELVVCSNELISKHKMDIKPLAPLN